MVCYVRRHWVIYVAPTGADDIVSKGQILRIDSTVLSAVIRMLNI